MAHEFDTFRRDDQVNEARWLAGLMFECSTDRLRAYEEIRSMQARIEEHRKPTRSSGPHLHFETPRWAGATPVVDRDGDYYDLQSDGRYRERVGGVMMSAIHLEHRYGPVKPIARPVERAS